MHDGYNFYQFKTCFCLFKSINEIICLIYSKNYEILSCYNLDNKQVLTEINKNNGIINDIRHYLDNNTKRDLILNSYVQKNEIEIQNLKNWEVLLRISHVNQGGYLFSACFYNYNNNIYILSSNNKVTFIWKCECIKVFDMEKNKIKEIKKSNEDIYYIDSYYDSKLDNNFIVTCNCGYIKFYDFNSNSLFKKYTDSEFLGTILDYVVDDRGLNKILIGSYYDSIIIWDFYSGEILKKSIPDLNRVYGLCLFDTNYLLIGTDKYGGYNKCYSDIILFDLNNLKIIKKINSKNENTISCIKTIDSKNGKKIISGGRWSDIVIYENKEFEFIIEHTIKN